MCRASPGPSSTTTLAPSRVHIIPGWIAAPTLSKRKRPMPDPRFLQIHFLAPYTAALLNRDDAGLAKRLPYGGALRTRVSSQCLKRHWRLADDPHGLHAINGADLAYRSRETVDRKVFDGWADSADAESVKAIKDAMLKAVYGE